MQTGQGLNWREWGLKTQERLNLANQKTILSFGRGSTLAKKNFKKIPPNLPTTNFSLPPST